MSIKEKSLKLAAVSLIADEAKKMKDKLRAELQEEMDSLGADRVKADRPENGCDKRSDLGRHYFTRPYRSYLGLSQLITLGNTAAMAALAIVSTSSPTDR